MTTATSTDSNYVWRVDHETELFAQPGVMTVVRQRADDRLNGLDSPLSSNFKTGSAKAQIKVRHWQLHCTDCDVSVGLVYDRRKDAYAALVELQLTVPDHAMVVKTWLDDDTGLLQGVSVNFSIRKTCNPTAQCKGCYAADKGALITWDRALITQYANTIAVGLNPVLFGQRVAQAIERPNILRRLDCVSGDYVLRWLGSGDLTPAIITAIVESLKATSDWQSKYGRVHVAAIFSRKPHMINRLISKARDAGVADRLAINMSLDGSDVGETIDRYKVVRDAGNKDNVRYVQYYNVGDWSFPLVNTRFPDHATKDDIELTTIDCPAIRTDSVNCMDCGACFERTVKSL